MHQAYEKVSEVFKHGQHSASAVYINRGGQSTIYDDHFSPASPNVYLTFRISEKIARYQDQLPRFRMYQTVLRIAVLIFALASIAFAFLDHALYVAIIVTIASAIDSWNE